MILCKVVATGSLPSPVLLLNPSVSTAPYSSTYLTHTLFEAQSLLNLIFPAEPLSSDLQSVLDQFNLYFNLKNLLKNIPDFDTGQLVLDIIAKHTTINPQELTILSNLLLTLENNCSFDNTTISQYTQFPEKLKETISDVLTTRITEFQQRIADHHQSLTPSSTECIPLKTVLSTLAQTFPLHHIYYIVTKQSYGFQLTLTLPSLPSLPTGLKSIEFKATVTQSVFNLVLKAEVIENKFKTIFGSNLHITYQISSDYNTLYFTIKDHVTTFEKNHVTSFELTCSSSMTYDVFAPLMLTFQSFFKICDLPSLSNSQIQRIEIKHSQIDTSTLFQICIHNPEPKLDIVIEFSLMTSHLHTYMDILDQLDINSILDLVTQWKQTENMNCYDISKIIFDPTTTIATVYIADQTFGEISIKISIIPELNLDMYRGALKTLVGEKLASNAALCAELTSTDTQPDTRAKRNRRGGRKRKKKPTSAHEQSKTSDATQNNANGISTSPNSSPLTTPTANDTLTSSSTLEKTQHDAATTIQQKLRKNQLIRNQQFYHRFKNLLPTYISMQQHILTTSKLTHEQLMKALTENELNILLQVKNKHRPNLISLTNGPISMRFKYQELASSITNLEQARNNTSRSSNC